MTKVTHKGLFTNPNNGLIVSACTIDLKEGNATGNWTEVTCKNCQRTTQYDLDGSTETRVKRA